MSSLATTQKKNSAVGEDTARKRTPKMKRLKKHGKGGGLVNKSTKDSFLSQTRIKRAAGRSEPGK